MSQYLLMTWHVHAPCIHCRMGGRDTHMSIGGVWCCYVVVFVVCITTTSHLMWMVVVLVLVKECVVCFGGRIGNNTCGELRSHPKGHRTNPGTEAEPQQIVTQGYSHAYSTTFHS